MTTRESLEFRADKWDTHREDYSFQPSRPTDVPYIHTLVYVRQTPAVSTANPLVEILFSDELAGGDTRSPHKIAIVGTSIYMELTPDGAYNETHVVARERLAAMDTDTRRRIFDQLSSEASDFLEKSIESLPSKGQ